MIQLSQFSTSYSKLTKDQQVFNCSRDLELKVFITVEDEVSFSSKYSLVASINHAGAIDQGHYWAVRKDLNSGDWSCNDKVVLTVPQHSLNNTTSYILFFT